MRGWIVIAAAFAFGSARADDPMEVGEILKDASGRAQGHVEAIQGEVVSIRIEGGAGRESERLWDRILDVKLPTIYAPRIGGTMIRFCTANTCPQWVAFERRNYLVVRSIYPDEEIAPGVMEIGATVSSPICVRARVLWLGQPARPGRIEGSFHPGTGQGIVWGRPVGRPRPARMSIGAGLGPWPDEAISITVNGGRKVRFVGGPIERHHDGCFEADVLPAAPLARTPAELAAGFAGRSLQTTIARGELMVDGRKGALVVIVRDDGRISIDGELATTEVDVKTHDVQLHTKTRIYDLDGLSAPLPGTGVASALVVARRMRRYLTGRVYAIDDVLRATPIGRFTLR